jgi:cell division protein ZapD
VIHYEYPLNERVRTLLRLEDLFDRYGSFAAESYPHAHHAALLTLFELAEVAGRADLRNDLLMELDRQRGVLDALSGKPGVDDALVADLLIAIASASESLYQMSGKAGQHLRENDWLTAIKQRSAIPGGTCEFDLPAYHHWRHRAPAVRVAALSEWVAPFVPIRAALGIVLRLLRDSGVAEAVVAPQGSYQLMLAGKNPQLVRLTLDSDLPCVPEIAANKYMLNVRFLNAEPGQSRRCAEIDVAFRIAFCNL